MAQTILLIDDSATIRYILKVYLMGQGIELLEAADGAKGLAMLRHFPVDLVIADVQMPVMDGLMFLKELRTAPEPHLRGIPVVLLTMQQGLDERQQGLDAGANAYLTKPVSSTELKQTVQRLLAAA
ncbi:MAG: response regulator [Myxococcaceae bacterium]